MDSHFWSVYIGQYLHCHSQDMPSSYLPIFCKYQLCLQHRLTCPQQNTQTTSFCFFRTQEDVHCDHELQTSSWNKVSICWRSLPCECRHHTSLSIWIKGNGMNHSTFHQQLHHKHHHPHGHYLDHLHHPAGLVCCTVGESISDKFGCLLVPPMRFSRGKGWTEWGG